MASDRPEEIKNTINILIGSLFVLGFIMIVIPTLRSSLGGYLGLAAIAFFVYRSTQYQDDVIGIKLSNAGRATLYGIISFVGFYFLSSIIPGFSITIPTVPQAVGDTMKAFVVIIVAPIIETLFAQGALYGYVRNFNPDKKGFNIALVVQAIFFAFLHLGAYIVDFYELPSFAAAATEFQASIGLFIAAFVWALVAGYVVTRDKVRNLLYVIVFHMGINALVYAELTVVGLAFLGAI